MNKYNLYRNVKTEKGDVLEKEFILGPLFTISLL